jgi:hypothetical protein
LYVQTDLARRTDLGEPGSEDAYQHEQRQLMVELERRRPRPLGTALRGPRLGDGENLVNVLLKFRRSDIWED